MLISFLGFGFDPGLPRKRGGGGGGSLVVGEADGEADSDWLAWFDGMGSLVFSYGLCFASS